MITLALAGKPNCGKSTFFRAATMAPAEIANYPFTTVNPNFGVAYIRTKCPCKELNLTCGNCTDGVRFVAVNLIDVAGLVPDAHKGRGLGNQFLDNLRQANGILHVVDASGGTDSEGNPVEPGSHDPREDIRFLRYEMTMWVYGILAKHWAKIQRQAQVKSFSVYSGVSEIFAGLGISPEGVHEAEVAAGIELLRADEPALIKFCDEVVRVSKPMIMIGNKADLAGQQLKDQLKESGVQLVSAAGELALRNAAAAHLIRYLPGDSSFTIENEGSLSPQQKAGLASLAKHLQVFGGTGVQDAINRAVFGMLDMIVVYPVEDENHYSDKKGRILPDAFLMKRGSTPHDLAFQVHTDIGKGFLYAIDAKTKMRIKETHELKDGDIIRIVSAAK